MTALVRSELLKLRTTRSWYAYLLVLVLLAALLTIAVVAPASGSDRRERLQVELVETTGIAWLLAIVLGITIVTTEFRHGTVTPMFLAVPRRERALAAKAIAVVLVAVGFALLALAVAAAIALPWVGGELQLGDGEIGRHALKASLGVVLAGLLGFAIGSVVHGQVAALVGTLVWLFLVETIVIGLLGLTDFDGVGAYLPFQALDAADGTGGGDLLSYWAGLGVSLGWIALLGAAGVERTRRRDIT